MKKQLLAVILLFAVFPGFAQLTMESGATIVVNSGSSVIVSGGITSTSATFNNKGTIENKGDLVNNTSVLFASSSTGTFKFNGTTAQEITGDHDVGFYGVTEIDNTSGVSVTNTSAGADQTINGELKLTNGTLSLNGFNLTIGSTDPTGAGTGKYVVTNGTGSVKRNVGSADVVFPVGNSAYNPITLNNAGASDDFSIKVLDTEPGGGTTYHMVNRSWEVTEATSGGSDLTVTAQWNSTEQNTGFDKDNCAIGLTTDGGTTYDWSETGAASGTGTGPYSMTNSSFTDVGTFAVGDYFYSGKRLDLNFFLAGAYNTTNGNMDKTLNTAGLIPTTDPYGMGTTAPSIPTDAVDWVKVILRDQTTPTTLIDSFAFFVNINGNLLDTLGNTGGKIYGVVLDKYNVEVIHRNHLGIMTSSTVDLRGSSTPLYNFTTGQAQAWQDVAISTNAAMKEFSTGEFGLWEGDANGDGEVQYEGGNPDRITVLNAVGVSTPTTEISPTYSAIDVNMDGKIQYEGGNPDRVSILNVVGVSTPTVAFTEHLPN